MTRDCEHLGLSRSQLAALTGFTSRAVAALAHLREAWVIADGTNRPHVQAAINELLGARSCREIRPVCEAVLVAGLDPGQARAILKARVVRARQHCLASAGSVAHGRRSCPRHPQALPVRRHALRRWERHQDHERQSPYT
jgi:hypothetical protein